MMKAIIIDDEQHCIDTLEMQLKKDCPDVTLIAKCRSGEEGIESIKSLQPDIVFLDIEMPVMTGFQMIEHLGGTSFALIFTTSFDQYAIKAIRFSALDYLLKPVDSKELVVAVNKVKAQRKLPSAEQFDLLFSRLHHRVSDFNKTAIPTLDGYELLNNSQLLYCEADDNYTRFHMKDKKTIVATRMLKEVEEQLQEFSNFARVHHSFIVNMNEVSRYVRGEGGYLVMSDGSTVNVSRSRKDSLLKWFQ
jgi:two-component system LytT family response regulator